LFYTLGASARQTAKKRDKVQTIREYQ